MSGDEFTVAEGDIVRLRNTRHQVFKVKRINLTRGTVDLWGGHPGRFGWYTVETHRLVPSRPGDAEWLRVKALGRRS